MKLVKSAKWQMLRQYPKRRRRLQNVCDRFISNCVQLTFNYTGLQIRFVFGYGVIQRTPTEWYCSVVWERQHNIDPR